MFALEADRHRSASRQAIVRQTRAGNQRGRRAAADRRPCMPDVGGNQRPIRKRHMPQTVTGAAPPAGASRRKIFSSHVRSGERSKTIRWPDSAPQPSM